MTVHTAPTEVQRGEHPLDVVERFAVDKDFAFDRDHEDEIAISTSGALAEYHIAFTWLEDVEAVHIACAFDLKVPERRRTEVLGLVSLINEQLWVGHFDVWSNDGIIMFRHALLFTGGVGASDAQCEAVLGIGLDACERHYQAFQFVLWAGKSPREALESTLFETSGEA